MEIRKRVHTVKVDYKCPKCPSGFLRPTGTVLTSNPPQYPHKCYNPDCDYGETFVDKSYPHLEYVLDEPDFPSITNFVHGKGEDEFCTDKKEPFDNYARRPSGK